MKLSRIVKRRKYKKFKEARKIDLFADATNTLTNAKLDESPQQEVQALNIQDPIVSQQPTPQSVEEAFALFKQNRQNA